MRAITTALLLISSAASTASSQIFVSQPPHSGMRNWGVDVGVQVAQPIGEFRDNVDVGGGIGTTLRHYLRGAPWLGVRGDLSFLVYGNERKTVPLSGGLNRVLVEMNTSNNILVLGIGPEIAARSGAVRPYLHGFAGYSYFFTESSAGDDDGGSTFASSTNYDDGGFAGGGGAGLRVPLHTRRVDVSIDAGARFARNGTRAYLREGDITDLPDGSLAFTPRVTTADFWLYHLGVSLTFGRR